jgi:hypothetical protein
VGADDQLAQQLASGRVDDAAKQSPKETQPMAFVDGGSILNT